MGPSGLGLLLANLLPANDLDMVAGFKLDAYFKGNVGTTRHHVEKGGHKSRAQREPGLPPPRFNSTGLGLECYSLGTRVTASNGQ